MRLCAYYYYTSPCGILRYKCIVLKWWRMHLNYIGVKKWTPGFAGLEFVF